jgi:hypothetical protein
MYLPVAQREERLQDKVGTFAMLANAKMGEEANPNDRKKAWFSSLILFYGLGGREQSQHLSLFTPLPPLRAL